MIHSLPGQDWDTTINAWKEPNHGWTDNSYNITCIPCTAYLEYDRVRKCGIDKVIDLVPMDMCVNWTWGATSTEPSTVKQKKHWESKFARSKWPGLTGICAWNCPRTSARTECIVPTTDELQPSTRKYSGKAHDTWTSRRNGTYYQHNSWSLQARYSECRLTSNNQTKDIPFHGSYGI
jgi:hypothetical protein